MPKTKKSALIRLREASSVICKASLEVARALFREKIYNAIVTGDTRNTKVVVVHLSANFLEEGLYAAWVLYDSASSINMNGGMASPSFREHQVGNGLLIESVLTVHMTRELDVDHIRRLLSYARKEIRMSDEARKVKKELKRLRKS